MDTNTTLFVICDPYFQFLLHLQHHGSIWAVAGSLMHTAPVLKNKPSASLNIIDSLTEFFD